MTVVELRKLLKDAPDNAEIVTSGFDHSYMYVRAEITTAVKDRYGNLSEDFGEEYDQPGDDSIPVVVFD